MRRTSTVVLILLILLSLAGIFVGTAQARPVLPARTVKSTLCGKLAFLEDAKTGTKLIGLIPCGESRPIIFQRRPSELLEYYRFKEVTIVSGPEVRSEAYGVIRDYITRFDSYTAINSCADCRPSIPGASAAGSSPDLACSDWALGYVAVANPALAAMPAFQEIGQNLGYFAKGQVLRRKCGLEIGCQSREIGRQLGSRLGPLLRQQGLTNPDVAGLLAGLLSTPDETGICQAPGSLVLNVLISLNQQGYAIDALSSSAEAAFLAVDAGGARSGTDEQGDPVSEIPGSQWIAGEKSNYLLLPAGKLASLKLRGTQNGAATLEAVLNRGDRIQYVFFKNFPVYEATLGELDLGASPPVLRLDAWGKGQFQSRQATFAEDGGLVIARVTPPTPSPTAAPPTATIEPSPTSMASPTFPATASPVPAAASTALPTPTPAPQSSPGNLCPLAFGIAALPGALWLVKRRTSPRPII